MAQWTSNNYSLLSRPCLQNHKCNRHSKCSHHLIITGTQAIHHMGMEDMVGATHLHMVIHTLTQTMETMARLHLSSNTGIIPNHHTTKIRHHQCKITQIPCMALATSKCITQLHKILTWCIHRPISKVPTTLMLIIQWKNDVYYISCMFYLDQILDTYSLFNCVLFCPLLFCTFRTVHIFFLIFYTVSFLLHWGHFFTNS